MIRGVYQPQFQMREGHFWFPVTIGSFLLSVTNPDFWGEPIFLQSFSFGFCSSSLTIHELFWIGVSGATNTPAHKMTTENKCLFAKFFAVQTIKVIIVQTNWFPCYSWDFVSISDFLVWGLRADQSLPGREPMFHVPYVPWAGFLGWVPAQAMPYLSFFIDFIFILEQQREFRLPHFIENAVWFLPRRSTINNVLKCKSAELERASFHMKLCDRGFQNNGVPLGKLCSWALPIIMRLK